MRRQEFMSGCTDLVDQVQADNTAAEVTSLAIASRPTTEVPMLISFSDSEHMNRKWSSVEELFTGAEYAALVGIVWYSTTADGESQPSWLISGASLHREPGIWLVRQVASPRWINLGYSGAPWFAIGTVISLFAWLRDGVPMRPRELTDKSDRDLVKTPMSLPEPPLGEDGRLKR